MLVFQSSRLGRELGDDTDIIVIHVISIATGEIVDRGADGTRVLTAVARDELHAIGHLLDGLPRLVGTAGVAIDRTAVARSAENPCDAFLRIDDTLHGGTGSTYAAEAKTFSRELAAVRALPAEHRP